MQKVEGTQKEFVEEQVKKDAGLPGKNCRDPQKKQESPALRKAQDKGRFIERNRSMRRRPRRYARPWRVPLLGMTCFSDKVSMRRWRPCEAQGELKPGATVTVRPRDNAQVRQAMTGGAPRSSKRGMKASNPFREASRAAAREAISSKRGSSPRNFIRRFIE